MEVYDYLIIGGGIFGVYAAIHFAENNKKVCLVEKESELLKKASIVNQARLHSGYHYPRSIATAKIANEYKERFTIEHKPFINFKFKKYYAIDKYASFTSSEQFERFCEYLKIKAEKVKEHNLFDLSRIEELYLTEEYSYDPIMIAEYYKQKIKGKYNIIIKMNTTTTEAEKLTDSWKILISEKQKKNEHIKAYSVINATYSGTNTINRIFSVKRIGLMHEVTELAIIFSPHLQDVGLTIMDGHFCSIMPYGLSNLLSLSSVSYTHHKVSYEDEPVFDCQEENKDCYPNQLSICNTCPDKPPSNINKMINQVKRYISDEVELNYIFSIYTIKSKLKASYIDDGRPTVISKFSSNPDYYCLFAGKINCIYEIESEVSNV